MYHLGVHKQENLRDSGPVSFRQTVDCQLVWDCARQFSLVKNCTARTNTSSGGESVVFETIRSARGPPSFYGFLAALNDGNTASKRKIQPPKPKLRQARQSFNSPGSFSRGRNA